MSYPTIVVLGGDQRQNWLASALLQHQALSAVYYLSDAACCSAVPHLTDPQELTQYDCIVGPVPLARQGIVALPQTAAPLPLEQLLQILQPGQLLIGGKLSSAWIEQCRQRQICTYDFLHSSSLALHNAQLTAEGMLSILLQETPYALQNTAVLLLGYGRCGMLLAQKLTALGCQVSICEAAADKRALAGALGYPVLEPQALPAILPDYELIVNTVPALVLTGDLLQLLPASAMIFDLASMPGGIDQEAVHQLGLYYQSCPGLPGRFAPQTAGELLAKDLLQHLAARSY